MKVAIHIHQLLQEHDCVIVPALGGFLAQRRSAAVGEGDTLVPPTRVISFNSRLSGNDGLLVHYVASAEGLGYNEALKQVEKFTAAAMSLLANGESVVLERIGKLSLDEENNLQFAPDDQADFFASAFGLRAIVAKPVEKTKDVTLAVATVNTITTATVAPKKTISFRRAKRVKQLRKYINYAALAILLIAISTVGIISYTSNLGSDAVNTATLAPSADSFFEHETPAETTDTEVAEIESAPIENTTPVTTPAETPVTETEPAVAIAQPATVEATHSPSAGYYVIVGAFANEANADALYNELSTELQNQVPLIKTKRNALTAVGFFAGDKYKDAVQVLNAAKEKEGSAWLLKM